MDREAHARQALRRESGGCGALDLRECTGIFRVRGGV
jgi:hypothetical protein